MLSASGFSFSVLASFCSHPRPQLHSSDEISKREYKGGDVGYVFGRSIRWCSSTLCLDTLCVCFSVLSSFRIASFVAAAIPVAFTVGVSACARLTASAGASSDWADGGSSSFTSSVQPAWQRLPLLPPKPVHTSVSHNAFVKAWHNHSNASFVFDHCPTVMSGSRPSIANDWWQSTSRKRIENSDFSTHCSREW